jgi:hypothetical protein
MIETVAEADAAEQVSGAGLVAGVLWRHLGRSEDVLENPGALRKQAVVLEDEVPIWRLRNAARSASDKPKGSRPPR